MRNLVLVALGFATVLFTAGIASTADAPKKVEADVHHAPFDKCATACSDCQRACDSCAAHCAKMLSDGKKEHHKTLQTCQDCATHCAAAAAIVARNGPFSDLICKACAEACARCGKECEKTGHFFTLRNLTFATILFQSKLGDLFTEVVA